MCDKATSPAASSSLSESIAEQQIKTGETDQQAFSAIAHPFHPLKNLLQRMP